MDTPIEVYANVVAISSSIYDVTLQFATQLLVVKGDGGEPGVLETSNPCHVRMSPQHAKALAALLAKQVLDYERRFDSTLPLPEDMQKLWDQFIREDKKP